MESGTLSQNQKENKIKKRNLSRHEITIKYSPDAVLSRKRNAIFPRTETDHSFETVSQRKI